MIRVFISHQKADEVRATLLYASLLKFDGVTAYLDVLDSHLESNSRQLTDHLRAALNSCTHLLAAVSENTKASWWVPFEIGLATEKDYPISTYALGATTLPDYLRKWPYLQSDADLARYVKVALAGLPRDGGHDLRKAATVARASYARTFHENLRRELGQR